jgi:hypothetical protein
MASAPPQPPESLIVGNFGGIRNTVAEERLKQSELAAAVNVDIDDAGQLRRRRGRTRINAEPHHSLRDFPWMTVVVRSGVLGRLFPDYSFNPIVPVGPEPLAYTSVGDMIYYSSEVTNGKISADGIPLTWGEPGAGTWVSPVVRPTETLGAIRGRQLTAPPNATCLEAYKGRIYMGAGPVIWATERWNYDRVDRTKNFLPFEADVTMIASVDDGLYVGTTNELLFLQGTLEDGFKLTHIIASGVIPGSCVLVPYSKAIPQARSGPVPEGSGPLFMTAAGIIVGMNSGNAFNLTQDHVAFPSATRAAALYREDQGANSYVAVADSAGGPVANARIGDYVDAEIVRASQRG